MTALPMTLEDALRHQGYTIDLVERAAFDITLAEGTIHVPDMVAVELTWQRDDPAALGDDLFLSAIPMFDAAYRPVILSHILDRYRTRRLGYNTPGEWRLAFRRWCNLNMVVPNRRYASTAVALPLDDRDETDATDRTLEATSHGLDVGSDFPQSLVSQSADYASNANDRRTADNTATDETVRRTGRGTSVMELLEAQRRAFVNVDTEVMDGLDCLFLGVYDVGEGDPGAQFGPHYNRFRPLNW